MAKGLNVKKEWITIGRISLLETESEFTPYVICYDYDKEKPKGSQWNHGSYFTNLDDATDCFACKTSNWTMRKTELMETMFSYIKENELLYEYCEDQSIVLTNDELAYFDLDSSEILEYREEFGEAD